MSPPSRRTLSRERVQVLLGVEESFLVSLEAEGLVEADAGGRLSVEAVERVRVCHTLHRDLGVNLPGLAVTVHLLERIESERRQFEEVLRWVREGLP